MSRLDELEVLLKEAHPAPWEFIYDEDAKAAIVLGRDRIVAGGGTSMALPPKGRPTMSRTHIGENALDVMPRKLGSDKNWWYEERGGISVYGLEGRIGLISWRSLDAYLKRLKFARRNTRAS